jgi:hypothetical protein
MDEAQTAGRRWWRYKRTWLIGLPTLLILGVVGLFLWGSYQPRPAGYAPSDPNTGVVVDDEVAPVGGEVAPVGGEVAPVGGEVAPVGGEVAPVEGEVPPVGEQWIRYTVDATSLVDWVLFDFTQGRTVDGGFTSPGWDVAFRRTKLLTNSGVTNPSGPGGAVDLGEVPLETARPPASVVFAVDRLGGDDDDEPENPAAGRWYSYSFITHIVSAKPNSYLVRTGESRDALVQFDSYYCEDEEAGCITFRYRLIPKVAEEGA